MTDYQSYHSYLPTRSTLAKNYRSYFLYPRLNRHLSGKVLDVGWGIGDFLRVRKNTVGTDINDTKVRYCQSEVLNVILFENDKLSFGDNEFDGEIPDNVLEYIKEPATLLTEIHRVLKSGAHFIVGVPGIKGHQSDSDHKRFYNDEDLPFIEQYGFREFTTVYAPLFKSKWLSKNVRQYCIYKVFRCVK